MVDNPAATKLTESLLSIIRLQRHLASRVLISTQEPTISPKLLDLCNIVVTHRFTSPEWLSFIKSHLAAVSVEETPREGGAVSTRKGAASLLQKIVELGEGEGYLFAPSGLISSWDFQGYDADVNGDSRLESPKKLGLSYLKIKIRKRLTADGGGSVFADSRGGLSLGEPTGKIPLAAVNALLQNSKKEGDKKGKKGRDGRARERRLD